MEAFDRNQLKHRAQERLEQSACSPKKLVLLYTAVLLGLSFVLSLLQFYLDQSIGETGGLSGIGMRSYLETAQSLLELANGLLLPFWQIGLVCVMLRLVRGQQTQYSALLEGFRHFGPVLRANLLRWGLFFLVAIIGCQVGVAVYCMTPAAEPLYTLAEQMVAENVADPYALLTEEVMLELVLDMLPFLLGGMLLPMIPVAYRLRMMDYVLMDRPELGAFFALRMSFAMTRKNCMKLFGLDVSFWWFYALELLMAALCYGDVLLGWAGVELGMTATVASFVFFALGLVCQLGLYVWRLDHVSATYALAYEALLPAPVQEEPRQ